MSENYDILKEFYDECKAYSLHEIVERWSGIGFSVPAFTGAIRDARIQEDYRSLSPTLSKERRYIMLAKKYRVSKRKIINVIKSATVKTSATHPSLFDV